MRQAQSQSLRSRVLARWDARARSLTLVVLLIGVACAKQPPTHYYLLEATPSGVASASRVGLSVGVRSLAVDTPYDESGIVYRVGRDSPEVAFYAYHEWASPLSRMVPRLISDALADTPGISVIEPVAPGKSYDATLEGRLIALEEVDMEGEQQVRLRMNLRLVREGEEIWRESIAAQAATTTDEVSRIVRLMNEMIVRALSDLKPGLAESLRTP